MSASRGSYRVRLRDRDRVVGGGEDTMHVTEISTRVR